MGEIRTVYRIVAAAALATAVSALGGLNFAEASVPAPHLSITDWRELPTPLPRPYAQDASQVATNTEIDAAFQRARSSGKRVFIEFGGNWCGWCRVLTGVMELPEVRAFVGTHFEVVYVEVTSRKWEIDRNLQVIDRFHLQNINSFPWVLIASADGHILNSSADVTSGDNPTPQEMLNWLAKWAEEVPHASQR